MKGKLIKCFPFLKTLKNNFKIKKRIKEIYNLYKENWIGSDVTSRKIGYKILLDAHSIEKGMISKNARYFGIQKSNDIMNNIVLYEDNSWDKDYAYNIGVSILHEYRDFYLKNEWVDRAEFIKTNEFIKERPKTIDCGVKKIEKKDFITSAIIDYKDFLSSRHSFREFETRKISDEDMNDVIEMTSLTPTACNRQMCKIYYVSNDNIKNKIIKFSHGLTNFDNESVNIIIVTYDVSAMCNEGEIQQGMFNAGLISMNLVNAMHSKGIGSCFLEFSNDINEENEMKKIISIPSCEKIAVVIAAGYYPEYSTIPCSVRKNIDDIYFKI